MDICDKQRRSDGEKLSNNRVCSAHFVSGKPAKNWDRHNQDWVPTLKLGHSRQSFNSPAAAAERNDRVLNRRKSALETELEKRNEKLKRLDECGHTVDKIFTVTVPTMRNLMKRRKIGQCLMFFL